MEKNQWEWILREVMKTKGKEESRERKDVILIGEGGCEKEELIKRWKYLQQKNNPEKRDGERIELEGGKILEKKVFSEEEVLGMVYVYLDGDKDNEGEWLENKKQGVNIWILEGNASLGFLLDGILKKISDIQNMMILVSLDWKEPWEWGHQCAQWMNVLKEALERSGWTSTQKEDNKKWLMKEHGYWRTILEEEGEEMKSNIIKKLEIPLTEGMLTHNLGVPISILCLKSDYMIELGKQYAFKEVHFDLILYILRRICLHYGAALFYVSLIHEKNIETTLQYILGQLFNLQPKIEVNAMDKDNLAIPRGWDSKARIDVLKETSDLIPEDLDMDHLESINAVLTSTIKPHEMQEEIEDPLNQVDVEDEQLFLARNLELLQKLAGSEMLYEQTVRPKVMENNPNAESFISPEKRKPVLSSMKNRSPEARLNESTKLVSANVGQNDVLANFFQSLLNKKSGSSNMNSPNDGRSPPASIRKSVEAELEKIRSMKPLLDPKLEEDEQ